MTVKFSRNMREMLLDGVSVNKAPIIEQHGHTLVRYNRIVISKDKIEFLWCGDAVFYFDMPNVNLHTGDTINIGNIEGSMECNVSGI